MARKKPKKPVPPQAPPSSEDAHRATQINLRIFDEQLLVAIDACAEQERRSRNQMINLLIEQALQNLGMWPPSSK